MTGRVLFYVQHLLGVGHIKRAAVIADALVRSGLDVAIVIGGPEVPGIAFDHCARIPLPPVRATDETFRTLVDDRGAPIDDALMESRRFRLVTEFEAIAPHVVMIEQFPFGRRAFRLELLSLLTAARAATPRPRIIASLRDILVHKSDPERAREMVAWARRFFDLLLVHGDPRLIRLEQSFPEARDVADLIRYTGYVVDRRAADVAVNRESGRGEVIVSAGGGSVGEPLLRAALAARPATTVADRPWRLITGRNLATSVSDGLAWSAPPGVVVERWRDDMPVLLRNCMLSVSQGGYNTMMECIAARTRSVIVPFGNGGETEQATRARAFAERGAVTLVEPAALSPATLARAIDHALATRPAVPEIDLDGAETTARLIAALWAEVGRPDLVP